MLKLSENLKIAVTKQINKVNNLNISSNLKENINSDKIKKIEKYIIEDLGKLKNKYGIDTYALLLSGDGEKQMGIEKNGYVNEKKIFKREKNIMPSLKLGFAKKIKTGNDYNITCLEKSQFRGKFYHSFDFSSNEKIKNIESYLKEVYDECCKKNISLERKSFDHSYDHILYSYEPEKLESIIQSIYPKYLEKGIFIGVYHFLQKPIDGIDQKHIGFAEEPLHGSESHSTRITKIGKHIDEGKSYKEACKMVGTLAEEPRRIDYESTYGKTIIKKGEIYNQKLKKEYLEYLKSKI